MKKYYPSIVKPAALAQSKLTSTEFNSIISTEALKVESVTQSVIEKTDIVISSIVKPTVLAHTNLSSTEFNSAKLLKLESITVKAAAKSSPLQLAIEESYDGFLDLWRVKSVMGKRDDWVQWGMTLAKYDKQKILSLDDRYMEDVDAHRTLLEKLSEIGDYGGAKSYIYFCGTLVIDAFKLLGLPPPPIINLAEAVELREGRPDKYRKWSYISWTKLLWTAFFAIEKYFGKERPSENKSPLEQSEVDQTEQSKQSTSSTVQDTSEKRLLCRCAQPELSNIKCSICQGSRTRYSITSKFVFQKQFDVDKSPLFYTTEDKKSIEECSKCCRSFFLNSNYRGSYPLCENCQEYKKSRYGYDDDDDIFGMFTFH